MYWNCLIDKTAKVGAWLSSYQSTSERSGQIADAIDDLVKTWKN